MPRFSIASRDAVPKDQVDAFDAIVSSRGGVVPEFGPVAVQLHVPEIAQRGEVLRAYLRAEGSTLSDNVAELAMITTARELDCLFIWHAHAAAGRRAGLSNALVDALRDKQELPPLTSAASTSAPAPTQARTTSTNPPDAALRIFAPRSPRPSARAARQACPTIKSRISPRCYRGRCGILRFCGCC